jgi:hypothetical protein
LLLALLLWQAILAAFAGEKPCLEMFEEAMPEVH